MAILKTRRRRIIALSLFIFALYVVFCIERAENPYDEVKIEVLGMPPNTSFICLVADSDSGPKSMKWSLAPMFGKGSMHPDGCSVSFIENRKTTFRANVLWTSSKRIGVLIKTTDGEWNVLWFRPMKTELKGRLLLFGGGSVVIDVSSADETQPMSSEQLKKLGMNYSLTYNRTTN